MSYPAGIVLLCIKLKRMQASATKKMTVALHVEVAL